MSSHTAGPWFVENLMHGGPRIVHGEPNEEGFRDDVVTRAGTDEAQANARLMAAAPDLLAALRDLYREIHKSGIKLDVRKHYSLLVADAAASKALHKVGYVAE